MTGPRYLELVKADIWDWNGEDWHVVQSSPAVYKKMAPLQYSPSELVLTTSKVTGTELVYASKIRRSSGVVESKEDILYNEKNRDYLLVVKLNHTERFNWHLKAFSNAVAVLVIAGQSTFAYFSPATHSANLFRELNMPLLVSASESGISSLKEDTKTVIHANEFAANGPEAVIVRA
jgi:hypothetical protein